MDAWYDKTAAYRIFEHRGSWRNGLEETGRRSRADRSFAGGLASGGVERECIRKRPSAFEAMHEQTGRTEELMRLGGRSAASSVREEAATRVRPAADRPASTISTWSCQRLARIA